MLSFNFRDYMAIASLMFLVLSLINFKITKIARIFIVLYILITSSAATIIMTEYSVLVGLLLLFSILFPITVFHERRKLQKEQRTKKIYY